MRRSLRAILAAALSSALILGPMTASSSAATSVAATRNFTITGTGFGHGIGMSQYGAQGYALQGAKYNEILAHYYQGTGLKTLSTLFGATDANPWVKVNIDKSKDYRSSWTMKGYQSEIVVASGATALPLAKNTYYTFTAADGKVVVNGKTLGATAEVTLADSKQLLTVKSASGPFDYGYVRYRGRILLYASGSTLKAVNKVPMEGYLYGVVPRESPASWRAEALKAQAVAARSYAWGTHPDADHDGTLDDELACTTASQVYGGHSRLKDGTDDSIYMHEAITTNAAVNDTAGKVVTYGSTVVTTYFFSQSGGRTANIEDVWASATPRPYYTSVSDPYEGVAGAPYCPWPADKQKQLDGLEMANELRSSSIGGSIPASPTSVTGISIERSASGYAKYTTFKFSNGASVRVAGADKVRTALGLLSPMYYFSGFPIERIYGADRYNTALAVSRKAFPPPATAPAVVLASGEDFADALTGSGLAGAAGGSLLLSKRAALPSEVALELKRLAPAKVYLMGSGAALSSAVEASVRTALPSATVARIAGADRYETAAAAAREMHRIAPTTKALLVSGTSWPDAAAASALAYARKYPILLTRQGWLSAPAVTWLRAEKPSVTIVAGSETVVSKATFDSAKAATGGTVQRLAGSDRYATSAAIARYLVAGTTEGVWTQDEVYLATGAAFPDALSGGVLAGRTAHALLLTRKDSVSPNTASYLRDYRTAISKLWIFGSTAAVSNSGFAALDSVMMN